jgi:hypothetical protein
MIVIIINFIFCPNIIYFCSVKLDFSISYKESGFKIIVFLSKINHSSIFFSFWATFNSFVNARYSYISVDCNDFEANKSLVMFGFLNVSNPAPSKI